jgi:hypothetical protein
MWYCHIILYRLTITFLLPDIALHDTFMFTLPDVALHDRTHIT